MTRLLLLLLAAGAASAQTTYHVAPGGDDGAAGTAAAPWARPAYAVGGASPVAPGDTVLVHEGVYGERVRVEVSGEPGRLVTLRAAPGERAVIDGAGLEANYEGLISVVDQSFVVVEGFEVRNFRTTQNDVEAIGIYVAGEGLRVFVRGNEVHGIEAAAPDPGASNAFGILVWGTGPGPLRDVSVEGNTVRDLTLGRSEALAVKCDVDRFQVVGNTVRDVDNIGIDVIGYEGCEAAPRDGVVRGNLVQRASSCANPSYGGGVCAAGGIYVDGGRDVIVERNVIEDADIGIELAAENEVGQPTRRVLARNNVVRGFRLAGVAVGAYEPGRAGTAESAVLGTTVVGNGQIGGLYLQHELEAVTLANNVVVTQGAPVVVSETATPGVDIRHTLFYASGAERWVWGGQTYLPLGVWQALTGQGASSLVADPQFAAAPGDLSLAAGSPAVDAGDPNACDSSCLGGLDAAGAPRVQGATVDMGAYERAPATPAEAGPRAGLRLEAASALPAVGAVEARLRVEAPAAVRVEAVDALGRRVAVLWDGPVTGDRALEWRAPAPGAYWLVARGGGLEAVLPVVVAR